MGNRGLSLLGLMHDQEVIRYLQEECGEPFTSEHGPQLRKQATSRDWRLPGVKPGRAKTELLDIGLHEHLAAIASNGLVQALVMGCEFSFRMVEIRPLICPPVHLNLDAVDAFRKRLANHTVEESLELCLPKVPMHPQPMYQLMRQGGTTSATGTVVTMNLDITLCPVNGGLAPLEWGLVRIANYQGRLILIDGFHRALAHLYEGLNSMPAIICDVKTGHPFPFTFQVLRHFNPPILMGKVPPMMAHLADGYGAEIPLRPVYKMVRVSGEESLVSGPLS